MLPVVPKKVFPTESTFSTPHGLRNVQGCCKEYKSYTIWAVQPVFDRSRLSGTPYFLTHTASFPPCTLKVAFPSSPMVISSS